MKYPEFVDITKIVECGNSKYRYKLFIPFYGLNSKKQDNLVVVLKNPSKASSTHSDVTVSKVCNVAKNNGYRSVTILNLFPLRATKAVDLVEFYTSENFKVECDINKSFIKKACVNKDVVFAWGTNTISKSKINKTIYNTAICEVMGIVFSQTKRVFYVPKKKQVNYTMRNEWFPLHGQCWSHKTTLIPLNF